MDLFFNCISNLLSKLIIVLADLLQCFEQLRYSGLRIMFQALFSLFLTTLLLIKQCVDLVHLRDTSFKRLLIADKFLTVGVHLNSRLFNLFIFQQQICDKGI